MTCPHCKVELLLSIREGIEIDCCPRCGGIWLDYGELLQIIMVYPRGDLKKLSDKKYSTLAGSPPRPNRP